MQEVALAKEVAKQNQLDDFVIPLKIDDLPRSEINIELKRITFTSFEDGWAKGLNALLEKLETDDVPKRENYSPEAVASWWREHFSADQGLQQQNEEHLSNWFVIESPPAKLFFHIFKPGISKMPSPAEEELVYPYQPHGNGILSFARVEDFTDGRELFGDTHDFFIADLLDDEQETFIDSMKTRDVITNLFCRTHLYFSSTQIRRRGLVLTVTYNFQVHQSYFSAFVRSPVINRFPPTKIGGKTIFNIP